MSQCASTGRTSGLPLQPSNALSSLDRILLIGQRLAWKSPLTFDGPKFRLQTASKYPKISKGNLGKGYCPTKHDANQFLLSTEPLKRNFSSCSQDHRDKVLGCTLQKNSEINSRFHTSSKNSNGGKDIHSLGSFGQHVSSLSHDSQKKIESVLEYQSGPLGRSRDLWDLNAGDQMATGFLGKIENHEAYLRITLNTSLLAHAPVKVWMSKSTRDKLHVLNEIWRRIVGLNDLPSAGITLFSECLKPCLTFSPSERILNCDKIDAVFEMNEPDFGIRTAQVCSDESCIQFSNQVMKCATNVSVSQFLLLILDTLDSTTISSV